MNSDGYENLETKRWGSIAAVMLLSWAVRRTPWIIAVCTLVALADMLWIATRA